MSNIDKNNDEAEENASLEASDGNGVGGNVHPSWRITLNVMMAQNSPIVVRGTPITTVCHWKRLPPIAKPLTIGCPDQIKFSVLFNSE